MFRHVSTEKKTRFMSQFVHVMAELDDVVLIFVKIEGPVGSVMFSTF